MFHAPPNKTGVTAKQWLIDWCGLNLGCLAAPVDESTQILFTINTGLLTSLCAVASLISLIVSPTTLVYASFYFCIGRLYSNALLASLNARDIIRGHINDVDTNFKSQTYHPRSEFSREVITTRGQGTAGPTELAIQIQCETELYGHKEYNKKECGRPEV
ncbi:hypothetical protein B0H13DRAFT_2374531 [Mycena leptocephala]|nr:hypothetical protein B0H13DRAFT_2374531 [Mycena leptocephala]